MIKIGGFRIYIGTHDFGWKMFGIGWKVKWFCGLSFCREFSFSSTYEWREKYGEISPSTFMNVYGLPSMNNKEFEENREYISKTWRRIGGKQQDEFTAELFKHYNPEHMKKFTKEK